MNKPPGIATLLGTRAPPMPDTTQYCGGCGYDRLPIIITRSGYLCHACAPRALAPPSVRALWMSE